MLLAAEGKAHFGSGSDALYQIDIETEQRRFSTLEDIAKNSRLLDKLDMFDFVMSTGLPQPGEIHKDKLYSTVFKTMTENTSKPIITTLTTLDDLEADSSDFDENNGGRTSCTKAVFYCLR